MADAMPAPAGEPNRVPRGLSWLYRFIPRHFGPRDLRRAAEPAGEPDDFRHESCYLEDAVTEFGTVQEAMGLEVR